MVAILNKDPKAVNVRGGSNDPNRGKWCTPKPVADALGRFDLDPFSNDRSHIQADAHCMLERGDNGLHFPEERRGGFLIAGRGTFHASESTRVFVQPPYDIVTQALDHYGHTKFCALLRFDPRTAWFRKLYRITQLVCVFGTIAFEPPPGVAASSNTFPHALYFADASDVTPQILRMTYAWRTGHRR